MNEQMDCEQFHAAIGKRKGFAPVRSQPERGTMNGTERKMADELRTLLIAGEILQWAFDVVSLRLAAATHYRPDFMIVWKDGTVEFRETKGGRVEDDSMVKLKVAATMFPHFQFTFHQWTKHGWESRLIPNTH